MPEAEVRYCLTNDESQVSRPSGKTSSPRDVEALDFCRVHHSSSVNHGLFRANTGSIYRGFRVIVEVPSSELHSGDNLVPGWHDVFNRKAIERARVLFQNQIGALQLEKLP